MRSEFRFFFFFPQSFLISSQLEISPPPLLLYVSHLQGIFVADIQEYMLCYLRKKYQISHCTNELRVIVEGVYSENGVVVSRWIV